MISTDAFLEPGKQQLDKNSKKLVVIPVENVGCYTSRLLLHFPKYRDLRLICTFTL